MRTPIASAFALGGLITLGSIAMAGEEPRYEDKPASQWIEAIGSSDEQARLEAATALRYLGLEAKGEEHQQLKAAVPALVAALKDKNEILRARAALALGNIDPVVVIGPMVAALNDVAWSVRVSAAYALAQAGPAAVPALIQALKSDNSRARIGAIDALRDIGNDARPAVAVLKEALKDPDPGVQVSAALALQKIEGKLPKPSEYGRAAH